VYQNSLAQNLEGMTGYLAWAIVCYLTLSSQPTDTFTGQIKLLAIVFGLLLFIIGFYFTTREKPFVRMDTNIRQFSVMGQLLSIIIIRTLTNSGVVAILGVALAAQLPIRFNRLAAYFGVLALIALDYFFNAVFWGITDGLVWTALAGAFNLFAFRMSQRVIQEQEARDEISMLNRELIATQALLQESTKQSERLRISRDLHDGLGHHLTALILKLQYLTYTTTGENKDHVVEAHLIAKELLTDVRETVHEMREGSNIGLKDAIDALIAQIPRLKINVDISDDIHLPDANTADTLFRCVQEAITNTLKHGNASEMDIALHQQAGSFELHVIDNGHCAMGICEGNGLKGMRERIENLRGQLEITTSKGFGLNIRIPNMEAI
jgi:signal transduction histidine kinase